MPQVSFTNQQGGASKFVLKPGIYEVALTDYEFGTSRGEKTAGSEQVQVKLETSTGCWIFDTIIFAENTAWRASAFLRCFGKFFPEGEKFNFDAAMLDSMIGCRGKVDVFTDKYESNGKTKTANRIDAYIDAKAPDAAPADVGAPADAGPAARDTKKYPATKDGAWKFILEMFQGDRTRANEVWRKEVTRVCKEAGKVSSTMFSEAEWASVMELDVPF